MDKVKGKSTTPPINSPVPQQPVESSTKPSFCSRCSKPIWCLLIAILVVAVIAIGGYYFLAVRNATPVVLNQQPPVTPMPTPTPDPTANPDLIGANWKTYESDSGLSFRYPPDWTVSAGDFLILLPTYRNEQVKGGRIEKEEYPRQKYSPITISVDADFEPPRSSPTEQVTESLVTIAGGSAILYTTQLVSSSSGYPAGHELLTLLIPHNQEKIVSRLFNPQFKEIYDQILSTFRFD